MNEQRKCYYAKCKYWNVGCTCDLPSITIDSNGKCNNFDKGLLYYTQEVINAMMGEYLGYFKVLQEEDLNIGVTCICELYGLRRHISEEGWPLLTFRKKGGRKNLSVEEIIDLDIDEDKVAALAQKIKEGNAFELKQCVLTEPQPNGWLSPKGVFITEESTDITDMIVEEKGWTNDYEVWKKKRSTLKTTREYLLYERGYCFICDICKDGKYQVIREKEFTPSQKRFLSGYFSRGGEVDRAKSYLEKGSFANKED